MEKQQTRKKARILAKNGDGEIPDEVHNNDDGKDPLQNPLILSKIFGFMYDTLSLSQWHVLRSQCQLWHTLTLKEWRSRMAIKLVPPILSGGSRLFQSPSMATASVGMPIDNFIKMFEPSFISTGKTNFELTKKEIPFTSFILSGISFCGFPGYLMCADHVPGNIWKLFEDMCQNAGVAGLKSLTFENCTFPGDEPKVFHAILTEKLTTLEKLCLKNTVLNPETNDEVQDYVWPPRDDANAIKYQPKSLALTYLEIDGETPLYLFFLLMHSPLLETLVLRNYWKIDPFPDLITLYMVYERRKHISETPPPLMIKHLDVMESSFFAYLSPSILPVLRACNMPLETLTMTLEFFGRFFSTGDNMPWDVEQILIPILQYHGGTLKSLKVFRPPLYEVCPRLGPFHSPEVNPLTALEELHIWGNLMGDFAFLSKVPNLRVLFIDPQCIDKADHLRKLHIRNDSDKQKCEFQKKYNPHIYNLMLNTPGAIRGDIHVAHLESLHLNFRMNNRETIEILAGWMPNLKIFRGVFCHDTFAAVCQYMPNLEILGVLLSSFVSDEYLTGRKVSGDEVNINPNNITALTKLKTFELTTACNKGTLTDISVYHGFAKMESLENLDISVSPTEFSPTAEKDLREHVTNVTVVRKCSPSRPRYCCRAQAFSDNFFSGSSHF